MLYLVKIKYKLEIESQGTLTETEVGIVSDETEYKASMKAVKYFTENNPNKEIINIIVNEAPIETSMFIRFILN